MASSNYTPLADEADHGEADSHEAAIASSDRSGVHLVTNTSSREIAAGLFVQTSNLATPVGEEELSSGPITTEVGAVIVVFPFYTLVLVLATVLVFAFCDVSDCSQPLAMWISLYVARHALKTFLYSWRGRLLSTGGEVPNELMLALAVTDFAGPGVWTLGGYYIFHTDSCSTGLYVYACILWSIQSLGLLLPCCFLSTLIFCAPFLVRLAPYLIRPNPNTIAASREVISRLYKSKFSDLSHPPDNTSCSICLSDYVADDEVVKLPCNHVFHSGCITSWLAVSQLCPVDRSNVGDLLAAQSSV